jgi:hypothetical protein
MWRICTKEGNPVILIPVADAIPEGYTEEGQTANPDYLELIANDYGRKITPLAFLNRFTMTEQVVVELASIDNPVATAPERQQAASLRVYLRNVNVAAYIDLDRADTAAGVEALEAATIIGVGRAAAILNAPVTIEEVPTSRRG